MCLYWSLYWVWSDGWYGRDQRLRGCQVWLYVGICTRWKGWEHSQVKQTHKNQVKTIVRSWATEFDLKSQEAWASEAKKSLLVPESLGGIMIFVLMFFLQKINKKSCCYLVELCFWKLAVFLLFCYSKRWNFEIRLFLTKKKLWNSFKYIHFVQKKKKKE